ncbi:hypothetical protein DH2020_024509 [Rehmannia glutinosa]|uniref:Uncharacterized protein n=1 Tax=Rehmannia glutinosa TaxID=99300 RepID=A0ABR0W340_REHGL
MQVVSALIVKCCISAKSLMHYLIKVYLNYKYININKLYIFSKKPPFSPINPVMASSISSLFLCPTTNVAAAVPLRIVSFSTKCMSPQHQAFDPSPPPPPPPSPPERKSFAMATGELFLGIASRVLKSGGKIVNGGPTMEMFEAVKK